MAPSIVWDELPDALHGVGNRLRVLDPMAGSGTTIATARLRGHQAFGLDTDPLAILIASAWASDVDAALFTELGAEVLDRARKRYVDISLANAYPACADEETKAFVRYWFDDVARRQLAALSVSISAIRRVHLRSLLWCSFSRMIIVKSSGVSLAMDVAHSRPHRVYDTAPVKPFDVFLKAVRAVAKNAPFAVTGNCVAEHPAAKVEMGDARAMPIPDESIDVIISSPPYLNAIDYLRGHKFSLIWMGHHLRDLRHVRATNVGTEVSATSQSQNLRVDAALRAMGQIDDLSRGDLGMLRRFVQDMDGVLSEMSRVLVPAGRAVLVIGDSTLRGVFVQNSEALASLGAAYGMAVVGKRRRPLPANRRYLPPPQAICAGGRLETRMRDEVILTLARAS